MVEGQTRQCGEDNDHAMVLWLIRRRRRIELCSGEIVWERESGAMCEGNAFNVDDDCSGQKSSYMTAQQVLTLGSGYRTV